MSTCTHDILTELSVFFLIPPGKFWDGTSFTASFQLYFVIILQSTLCNVRYWEWRKIKPWKVFCRIRSPPTFSRNIAVILGSMITTTNSESVGISSLTRFCTSQCEGQSTFCAKSYKQSQLCVELSTLNSNIYTNSKVLLTYIVFQRFQYYFSFWN